MAGKLIASEEAIVQRIADLAEKGSQQFGWDHPEIKDMIDDLRKAKIKAALAPLGVVVRIDLVTRTVNLSKVGAAPTEPAAAASAAPAAAKPVAKPPAPRKPGIPGFAPHTYHCPAFHEDMKRAISDAAGLIVCGVGPTGSGKTCHLKVIAEELNMEFVLVNCHRAMEMANLTGEKTVEPDETTKAAVIKFLYGPIVKAMRTGLDKDGNEVGKPAILGLDEYPALPAWCALGLNNLLETRYPRRSMMVAENGGEHVLAHSGFRIVLLGNTIGRGITMETAEYTAQGDALDISTLDRVSAIFNYGYSKNAEEKLLAEKIGDDAVVRKIVQYRDAIRKARREQGMKTPLSTRLLVHLADAYRVFGGDIGKALLYSIVNKTMPHERPVYIEQALLTFGVKLEKIAEASATDYDY
jgi:MoxR-like ATPase